LFAKNLLEEVILGIVFLIEIKKAKLLIVKSFAF